MDANDKIVELLENMAVDITGLTDCVLFWGEEEVPECLKEEIETDKQ